MSSTMEQYLSQTTAETFENLALLFADESLMPEQEAEPLDVAVSVEFRGPRTGRLVLRASGNLLPSIAANMLGEAESARTPLQRDALGEIANVITGNVLPLVEGRDAVFHLDAPRVHEGIAPVSRDDDRCEARTTLGIENGRVQAELFFF